MTLSRTFAMRRASDSRRIRGSRIVQRMKALPRSNILVKSCFLTSGEKRVHGNKSRVGCGRVKSTCRLLSVGRVVEGGVYPYA